MFSDAEFDSISRVRRMLTGERRLLELTDELSVVAEMWERLEANLAEHAEIVAEATRRTVA